MKHAENTAKTRLTVPNLPKKSYADQWHDSLARLKEINSSLDLEEIDRKLKERGQ